jgi:hypothetical protein
LKIDMAYSFPSFVRLPLTFCASTTLPFCSSFWSGL